MRFSVNRVALLLLGSGFCALVYQVAWLRLLRLIFGSSTPATAAVVAIFMAGIGFGSLILGNRVDRKSNPLAYYSKLEFWISLLAGLSPVAIVFARWAYTAGGGTAAMGPILGPLVRLLLAVLVLGLPTFLMGGTLPAVTRSVERSEDRGRRLLGLLYGSNTIGAVLGALATTFFSIELLGIKRTIWVAALINLLVAMMARQMSRDSKLTSPDRTEASEPPVIGDSEELLHGAETEPASQFVLSAAALVGFCFFLMELVWYRMLAPLLGGSSYTFGLILAMALLGIGVGGLAYGAGAYKRRPTMVGFATTCSLEALLIIIPFALGDRLAFLAAVLRDLSGLGFGGLIVAWTAVTAIVVLPASIVAGYQFPLLVAALGSGSRNVGRQVGRTYAWNTLGAIAGSLAGGFGLIPLIGAIGAWRLVVVILVILAAASMILGRASVSGRGQLFVPLSASLLALVLAASLGPTAFWRHSPIGAGRLQLAIQDSNELEEAIRFRNRVVQWEVDGRESSVSLQAEDGLTFYLNGKSDGHARTDAPTQVMSGLIGAALSPDPRRALVIGLGTGSSAGWLAEVSTMESVDVVELEPAITNVARACSPVNHNAMDHPKVHLIIGDAREVLVTARDKYDIIFSEPSNPYRAGISSLFSSDFYRAVLDKLNDDGILIQWLQGYEVDGQVVRTALATLKSVFGSVETWSVHQSDLLLVASRQPLVHDIDRIRARIEAEPFRSALSWTWGVKGVEGLYAGFIAPSAFAEAIYERERLSINTDDRPLIEFGFARNLGRNGLFQISELRALVSRLGMDQALGTDATLDWNLISEMRAARDVAFSAPPTMPPDADLEQRQRIEARALYVKGDLVDACSLWLAQHQAPQAPIDTVMIAECLAESGDDRAAQLALDLRQRKRGVEADAVTTRWHARNGRWNEALESLVATFEGYRADPWSHPPVIDRLLRLSLEIARHSPEAAHKIFAAAESPFSVRMFDLKRRALLYDIARLDRESELCVRALGHFEPLVPWDLAFLTDRWQCYEKRGSPLAARALRELEKFRSNQTLPLGWGLGQADKQFTE